MGDEKIKTALEISVDDRLLRRFSSALKTTFDTAPIEKHKRAQQEVTRELERQRDILEQRDSAAEKGVQAIRSGSVSTAGRSRDRGGRFTASSRRRDEGGDGGGRDRQREPMGFFGTAAATGAGFVAGQAVSGASRGMAGIAGGYGATAGALGAIPLVGPALAAAWGAAEQLADAAISFGQATAGAAGITGLGKFPAQRGLTELGIGRSELPGRMTALGQQSGLRGGELQRLGPGAMTLEALTGIRAGGMASALGTAGGSGSAERTFEMVNKAITSGMDAGFREGRLGQFVQDIATNIEQMRNRGMRIDPEGMPALVRLLGTRGMESLRAEAGMAAAQGMRAQVSSAGDRGDFYGALALEAVMGDINPETKKRYTPYEASLALEENPEKFIPKILDMIGSMGGDEQGKAMALRQFMPNLSKRQALELARTAQQGGMAAGFDAQSDVPDKAVDFVKEQRRATEDAFKTAAAAAGLEDRRIGEGGKVVGDVLRVRGKETSMAGRAAPIGAGAADMMSGVLDRYSKAIASGDMDQILGVVMQDMSSMFDKIQEAFMHAADALVDKLTKGTIGSAQELGGEANRLINTAGGREQSLDAVVSLLKAIVDWLNKISAQFGGPRVEDVAKAGAAAAMGSLTGDYGGLPNTNDPLGILKPRVE